MKTQPDWSCSICGNHTTYKTHFIKEMMFGLHHEFEYVECGHCQCLSIKSTPEDLSVYYPTDYYSFSSQSLSSKQNRLLVRWRNQYTVFGKPLIGKLLFRLFPKNMLSWLSSIGLQKDTAVLDVGCGSGKLLYFLKDQGMKKLTGIDPFLQKDIISSKELTISKNDIFSISGTWDVIWFLHVFEHMDAPLDVLKKTASLLSSGGQCIIAIPTVSGEAWENYGSNWVQLDAPRHLFLHSQKSMEFLAEKSDFSITRTLYNSTGFQFWGSEQTKQGIPLMNAASGVIVAKEGLFSKRQMRDFEKKAKQLNKMNRGDQAIFFMRKN